VIQNLNLSLVMVDNGYTTGVAYINNCTAKPINTVKSLYLVVIDEMMMPSPRPRPAIMMMMVGIRMRVEGVEVIEGVEGASLYQSMAARRSRNWIPNFTILLITVDNGITSLGKYTFPKMPALATNVLEVAFRQEEK
jgi:hypothetical protein